MALVDWFKRKPTAAAAPAAPTTPAPAAISPFDKVPKAFAPSRPPRDLPIVSTSTWDNVSAVRAALTDLDRGQFAAAAALLDTMLSDSHIGAKLDDRVEGLFGSEFSMTPPPGLEEDAHALEVAADATTAWDHVITDDGHKLVMRDGIMLGAGLGEVVVEPAEGEWTLRLKHWHARHLWWNWGTRTYWVNTLRGPEELKSDGTGGWFSTWKDSDGTARVSRWLLYTPYGYQRGWVNARIKRLAIPWLLRSWGFRDWGRHSEVLGVPPRKVKMPASWSDEEKQQGLREVAALASEGVIRCPQKEDGTGFDVELMELKGPNATDTFSGLIEKSEGAITVALVGQTLTTQNDKAGGSRALGEVHERVEGKIRKSDAGTFSRAARSCIVRPWTEWNVGDTELTPVPTWMVEPPEDLKTKGDGMKAVGDGLSSLKLAGIPVDRAKVCTDAGIPLEEGVAFEEPTPPPSPFGAKPGEPNSADGQGDGEDGNPEKLSRAELSRRSRAPLQGQVYADDLADAARDEAARLLAGDVRAIKQMLATLKPTASGGIDVEALRAKLTKTYAGMDHSKLARLTEKVLILAALSGRYAVQKEL